jgi:dTDP-L-rhamnose 4-epimerase
MFKRVLVTGGAGFIGSHLVDLLLKKGYEVRVFDNLEPQVHGDSATVPGYLNKNAEFVQGDVLDRDALQKALNGCDAVVHDAAMVGVGQSQYQVSRYTAVNALGTANLIDILVNEKTSVQRLLVASSMSIYGEGLYKRPSDGKTIAPLLRPEEQMARGDFELRDPETGEALEAVPTPESKPLHCTSFYALGKKDQEEYCLLMSRIHNIPAVACRFFNVYGTRQSLSNPYTGAAAIFSSRIKNGNSPLIYEDGLQSRDFVSVHDIVAAKVFLLANPQANSEAYNVCSGKGTSILEVASTLARLMGRPEIEPECPGTFRAGDIRHCFGDGSKLGALGWAPKVDLEEGFRELVEWTEQQEAVDRVDQAHQELVAKGLVRSRRS